MKKILVIGLISSFISASAFAGQNGACTATAAVAGTATSATTTVGDAATPTANSPVCVCDGNVAGKQQVNGGPSNSVGTPVFVKTGFDVQCSNNTIVSYNEVSGVAFAVASGSRKGNRTFKGSSAGGGVAEVTNATCANGCGNGEVTNALAAAVIDSSS